MAETREIIVYGPARSPFIEKVRLGLAFKGLDCKIVEPSGPEDFRRWNPETGMLPVMDFDGVRIPDSTGILDWLDQKVPEPPLSARDPWTARSQRMLEVWIGETFYYFWVRWLREQLERGNVQAAPAAAAGGELARLGILGRVGQLLSSPPRDASGLGPQFDRKLDDLVSFLGRRRFFYADRPGRADLTAVAFVGSLERGGVIPGGAALLAGRPPLVELIARVREALAA